MDYAGLDNLYTILKYRTNIITALEHLNKVKTSTLPDKDALRCAISLVEEVKDYIEDDAKHWYKSYCTMSFSSEGE